MLIYTVDHKTELQNLTSNFILEYFGQFGTIDSCEIPCDRENNRPRGFGFVTFNDYDPVDKLVCKCKIVVLVCVTCEKFVDILLIFKQSDIMILLECIVRSRRHCQGKRWKKPKTKVGLILFSKFYF